MEIAKKAARRRTQKRAIGFMGGAHGFFKLYEEY
jgi:hypothetical protein